MKQVMKNIVVAGAMIAAGSAVADLSDVRYRLGVDYLQSWMAGKGNSTLLSYNTVNENTTTFRNVLPKSYPGAALYLGAQFSQNFGVEVGADMSARKTRNFTQADVTNGAPGAITGTTKVRRTGYHFDVVGFLPLQDCIDLFASAGYGYTKAKTEVTVTGAAVNFPGVTTAAAGVNSKGKGVARLGVGASWMFTDMFGVRAKLGWEATSRLRMNEPSYNGSPATNNKAFKDTTSLALGLFYKF